MPLPVVTLARDTVPLLGLALLLAVAYAAPAAWIEATAGLVAATAALATGALSAQELGAQMGHLLPVVVFLAAILVVAEVCRVEGLFAAVGDRLRAVRHPRRRLRLTFGAAAATTATLSLDATVVLLTPVVVAAEGDGSGDEDRAGDRAGRLACVRLANSGSLLLPVSNLTNLLALGLLPISFGRFAVLMTPVWGVVLAVEYAALRWWTRGDDASPVDAGPALTARPVPRTTVAVVLAMLLAFAATSPLGVDPAWPAVVAALVLGARALRRDQVSVGALVRSAQLPFGVFVLGLGVVVAVLGTTWLGDLLGRVVPAGDGLGALLVVALLGALLANLVNNLPATLLMVPLVAPLGVTPVLALLVGVNLGSSMTWTGSLANLLWRRTLVKSGVRPPSRDFHGLGLVASPAGIVLGVLVLSVWTGIA